MRLIDADRFITTLDTVVQKHESKLWRKIAETMKYMIETQAEMFPVEEPTVVRCGKCKYWTGQTSEIDPEMRQCEFGLWMEQTDFCSKGDDGKIPMPGVYARPQ